MQWPDDHRGTRLGVLMLDTAFPRPVGDIGNPDTFPFPVDYLTVPAASADRVVRSDGPAPDLRERFLSGAERLVGNGATIIATSCGFLSVYQSEFQQRLPVPFVASALNLLPDLHARFGAGCIVGILTFNSRALSDRHLPDTSGDTVVEGLENGRELYEVIRNDRTVLDHDAASRDAVEAAGRLVERRPDVSALLLECTNLPPYRDAIEDRTGRPVFDIRDAIAARLPVG